MEVEQKSSYQEQTHPGLKDGSEDERYLDDGTTSTPAETARLRQVYRKLDLRIIPAFWVLYFLCSAVRANVGYVINDIMLTVTQMPRDE